MGAVSGAPGPGHMTRRPTKPWTQPSQRPCNDAPQQLAYLFGGADKPPDTRRLAHASGLGDVLTLSSRERAWALTTSPKV